MFRYLIAVLLFAAAMVGCADHQTDMVFDPRPGEPGDGLGDDQMVMLSMVQQQVLDVSCALSGCHADAEYPNLSASHAFFSLIGGPSSVDGVPLVTPGDPEASYLMTKITGGRGMLGARMPASRAPLDSTRIALVRAWIAQGAAND